ncbi:Zn(II)2Cys6 transcription factor domain-containing protein [Aspergillus clavatus NRRL 1]|uniref:C6 zinc finger domain protein n=1 Tax=Aspergillus clavatus (strain ATCC 1007 / CBS 513.65 / DSM 816 / NCTC 3887 / NRRL 1 / QM 1276 / 107) TaxID=344612 RepID=A1CCE5_ASPCL|nr:C6 zinc finger domain protein [Aspergillus clavatus NRRL 1]EAW12202.1 C6 zinc finger domain protein [Aspergillus clavatus NRRL 1]
MVGVPRSSGCQICVQRRVKCDLTTPECQRCQRRGQKCPGYTKRWKFYDQTTSQARAHKPTHRRAPQAPDVLHGAPPPAGSRSAPLPIPGLALVRRCSSMDERVEPNLAASALDLQQQEVFCQFLLRSFPAQFASCGGRVEVNWMDYARRPIAMTTSGPQALVWAFRSITTFYVGRMNADTDKITCSRHMYSRALGYLAGLILHPRYARHDETLAAAILLTIYEMLDATGEASWLSHSRGVSTLIRLRGPAAHRAGFGLTLLKSCRSFLVADAFLRGDACFLGYDEWRALMEEIADAESLGLVKSELGLLVDRAFIEIAACPGRLADTRALLAQGSVVAPSSRNALIRTIVSSRNLLSHLRCKLELGAVKQKNDESFTGPIPWNFVDPFAQSSLHGIRSGIALLSQLLVLIDADAQRRRGGGHVLQLDYAVASASNPWAALERESVSWHVQFDPEFVTLNIAPDTHDDWMDRVAMSMGMLGLRL